VISRNKIDGVQNTAETAAAIQEEQRPIYLEQQQEIEQPRAPFPLAFFSNRFMMHVEICYKKKQSSCLNTNILVVVRQSPASNVFFRIALR
jgi:hypothetical protein